MGIQIARAAVLLLAAALRLWRLNQNGYDNEYYAAAVRSMASGWHAFLYNAFDPTGFVSVDKPPVALWLQALAVKLFGFHGLTVLLPQGAEGVAALAGAGVTTGSTLRCGARASPPTTSRAGPRPGGRHGRRVGSSSTTSSVARS